MLEEFILPCGDLLLGTSFIRNLKKAREEIKYSEKDLLVLQSGKLRSILEHAGKYCEYYRALGIEACADPFDWVRRFPILDKKILKEKQDELLTRSKAKLIKGSSSGSSGFQSTVYNSKREVSIHRAIQILWWEWAGYQIGKPILQTGMNMDRGFFKRIKDIIFNTYYLQAFSPSKADMFSAFSWAKRQKKPFLAGYASSLYILATNAVNVKDIGPLSGAVSWGDKLFDHYRRVINDTFSINIKETYGSGEGMMIAAQADLQYMYIMMPYVYLEILDDNNNPVPDGEMGHVVVTNLNSYAMPLIRYKIGDLAIRLPKSDYPPNRQFHLPLLQKVIGRDTDLVRTSSGKYMVVHSFTGIFEHIPEILQFCVIQENLTGITINYITGFGFYTELLEVIKNKILSYLKEDFIITFNKVEFISPTKSGKPQIIISNIGNYF